MTYEYEVLEPGSRQYDEFDFKENNRVPARYIKSCCSVDNGNVYIEALPLPREGDEVNLAYTQALPDFDSKAIQSMTSLQKQISVASLRNIRVVLPFHPILEQDFYLMLVQSYRNRKSKVYVNSEMSIVQDDQEVGVEMLLHGNAAASANAGCTMLGYSGCGKSSSLEILLSNYPQVIEHHTDEIPRFTQIVYLVVVCPANSNFSALYASIGAEIDIALGNTKPIYKTMINKCKTLAEKADKVCELISLFGIGCIIFDEIQLIDFGSTKENSFESLLTIVNKTKVALFAVGTEDAYEKMFPNIRTSRRTGSLIYASQYCNSKNFFAHIVAFLMQYQWFDEPIQPTEEIVDALYQVTKGIVDQLIAVYMYMQIDYLRARKKPVIDGNYVIKIAEKHFPGMQKLLSEIEDPEAEAKRIALMKESREQLEKELRQAQMEESMTRIIEQGNNVEHKMQTANRINIIKDIKKTLSITGDVYNDDKIANAVDCIMRNKNNVGCTEDELANKAYQLLKKRSSDKRPTSKKAKQNVSPIQLRNLLDECTVNIGSK